MTNGTVYVCMTAYTDYVCDARVRREAETLAANGFHVRVLCLRSGGRQQGSRYLLQGVEVRELPVAKYRGKSTAAYMRSYLQFLLSSSVACAALLLKGELDVVHAHNIPDFLVIAGLIPRLAGRKVVLDVHDSVPETFAAKFSNASMLARMLDLEERLSTSLAHRVICVNHPQRDALVARGLEPSKTFISMNVPDPRIFSTAGGSNDVHLRPDGTVNLVYHGTMAARLGVDLAIRAVAQLQHTIPGARLHLWGHGDDLVQFQQLARELKVADRVLFEPRGYPLQDLPRRLGAMDIGVIGNRRTAAGDLMLPVKLLEYISVGIPVVAPRLKTIQHYLSDEMVAYYDAEDVDSLTAAIERLYHDHDLRDRQAAKARTFLADHGWERQGRDFVQFYQSIAQG